MSKKRKISYVLLAILILIQFIRPSENTGKTIGENSVVTTAEVNEILQKSCFDCHSNNTEYPWYCNIQPIGWWTAHHVNEGKEELNFSEFNSYTLKRKLKKLKEIKEQLDENEMPLSSYTFIHSDAKLSSNDKNLLLKWVNDTKDKLVDTIPH
ncbi:MAG: cytochrome C [Bacteroidetes bacterium RIFCSPLOWO2_12_FULL_35_15]|nr:MAG: cytochrome C [Bacteroidetes bacterium RIFCSPLOWO2_12_FULL_35_15]